MRRRSSGLELTPPPVALVSGEEGSASERAGKQWGGGGCGREAADG